MGRPPTREPLHEQRCRLAASIDDELNAGQRPSGPYKGPRRRWTEKEFAHAANATENKVKSWRNREKPTVPTSIYPLLAAFYGEIGNREFENEREHMRQLFAEAGGNTDAEPDPWTIVDRTLLDVANPVALMVNQPDTDNATGALRLPFTLQFRRSKSRTIKVRLNGATVETSFDLGLKEAWLSVKSPKWQPTEGSLFRAKDKSHPRVGGRFGNALRIVPGKGEAHLADEPLSDEPAIPLEIEHTDGAASITVAVAADEAAFDLTIAGAPPRNTKQSDVIAAILRTATERDHDDRIVIESKTVMP